MQRPTKRLRRKVSTSPHLPVCDTMSQSIAWMAYVVGRAFLFASSADDPGSDIGHHGIEYSTNATAMSWLVQFAVAWFSMTLSTAFSGIGAPEVSVHMVDAWLVEVLGVGMLTELLGAHPFDVRKSKMLWAIESSTVCRAELLVSSFCF